MKSGSCLVALALAVPVVAGPGSASADALAILRKVTVTGDAPLAVPVGAPLADRFGWGAMPAVSAAVPVRPWMMLGLRLRCGFLKNGPAPSDPTLKDPGTGGLGALLVTARVRPLAADGQPLTAGPWVDVGVGPGLTGSLVRAVGEAGLGWNFSVAGLTLGPTARYLHVLEPSNALDSTDAKILLFGIEIALYDPQARKRPEDAAAPLASSAGAKVLDRDGDGIPDDVDKCPDDPEDKDGFQDEDGCPDPDNDNDGIPDAKDACPNEPETVNGFQDDDGCPDEAAIVVKKDRILLNHHVLFDTNRARVNNEGRPALVAVLNLWRQHPEWDHLIVDGHADRRGPDRFNLWLSHVRAERVRNKLIEMGFPEDKLTLRAFGRQRLPVPGEGEEADRENRRVEFVIVKKSQGPAQTASAPPAQPNRIAAAGSTEASANRIAAASSTEAPASRATPTSSTEVPASRATSSSSTEAPAQAAPAELPPEAAGSIEPPPQATPPLEPPPEIPDEEEAP